MKAIRIAEFGEPSVLKLVDVGDPVARAGEVVVRVQAVGVNPVETYIRKGIYGAREFPFTPGSDAAGVVESVGEGVARYRAGDRVYVYGSVTGTYAQKALCRESQVYPLAAGVSFGQGAALGVPYGTAYKALFYRGQAQPGETVLIHGASGGVGTAATQLARATGLRVIGTAGTDAGRKLVTDQGAHDVLDHTRPDYLKELMDLTGGRGVNLIVEMLANVNLGKDLCVLAKFGRVVVVGSRGAVEINPRETMMRDADIRGMTLMNVSDQELAGIHAALAAGLENGSLQPVIRTEMPLAQAPKAHEMVMESGAYGKIVLVP